MANTIKTIFEIGKVYECGKDNSFGCVLNFEVKKRTARTIIMVYCGEEIKCKIMKSTESNCEYVVCGEYEGAPIIFANDELKVKEIKSSKKIVYDASTELIMMNID